MDQEKFNEKVITEIDSTKSKLNKLSCLYIDTDILRREYKLILEKYSLLESPTITDMSKRDKRLEEIEKEALTVFVRSLLK